MPQALKLRFGSLQCAFQRRCDASYEGLRKAVEAGAAGALRSVRCTFRDLSLIHI